MMIFTIEEVIMSKERLSMRKIHEVLRLKWESRLSHRTIAQSCGISPGTVSDYVQRAQAIGLTWPLPNELDEEALYRRLFPQPSSTSGRVIPQPDWAALHTQLRRPGVTLRLLWVEYREANPDGYAYTQFCEHYREWAQHLQPSMRQVHKAGEKLFVDYAGQTIPVVHPQTGEICQAQLFVAVLGASSYTYVEAQWQQDLRNWIGGHVRALAFFGGVPEVIVPDNLKAGVQRPCRYEPDLNPTYQDFAQHYGVAVIPARVRKPKDKAKVEVGVQVVERWIAARLRDRTFFGLADLNASIRELLGDLNDREMRHLGQSRHELLEALDRPALRPLPAQPYEFAFWKKARVNIDYHVEFEKHFYSVPHPLIHKEVDLRATENTLEIFYHQQRQASHPRSAVPGRYTTLAEHMPQAHQHYAEWSPERFIRWAEQLGPHIAQLIVAILGLRLHPQQAYRTCLGILGLAKRYTAERLDAACQRALPAGIRSYKGLRNILDAQLDQLPPPEPAAASLPDHANLRGPAYYH
jgi:transposase